MTGTELLVTIVAGVAILTGIAGTFLPILPGLFLVWAAMLGYGVFVGFGLPGWTAMALATGLLALGLYLNVRIPQRTASISGLSIGSQLASLVLAVVGFFVVPVIGFPLGFVLGVFAMRYRNTRDGRQAWVSTKATMLALFKASAAQAACGIAMLAIWIGWAVSVAAR